MILLLTTLLPAPCLAAKKIRIGVPIGFPPFSYQEEDTSLVRGYSVDVLNILCGNLSTEAHYLVGREADLLHALREGVLDLVIGSAINEHQRQAFNTFEILIYVKRYLFVHHPTEPTFVDQGRQVKSVVVGGQPYLTHYSDDVIQTRTIKEALTVVNSGQAREFIDYSDTLATYLIGKHGLQNIRQAGVQMRRFPFTMITAKENVALSSGLSRALGEALKSGQFDQVREKWLGQSYAAYLWQRFSPLIIVAGALVGACALFLFLWHLALKRQVTKITSKLRVSEERYRQLIDSSPDMVFLINKDGLIRLVNQSTRERLLVPKNQLLASTLQALVVPQDRAKYHAFLSQLFVRQIATLETKLLNYAGLEIHVEFVAARLRRSSEEERLACCFARDLTQRKRMERELIATERLATIGKMAAGVAHEVNNPIGIIFSHAEDLISGELDEDEAQESLSAIRRNALRAGNITRALLDQASSDGVQRVDLDLAILFEECLTFLKPRLKKVEVLKRFTGDNCWVQGDESQLQQVVINLLLNAIEAMAGEGTLRLSVTDGRMDANRRHRIRIEDSGKGIPTKDRPHIFDPFFTNGKTEGVGLGLFVAARIIKKHHGSIVADDSALGGIAMNIDLPVKSENSHGDTPADR